MLRRHRLYCCSDLHASKESSVNMYTAGYEDLHSWSHRSRRTRDDRPHQPGLARRQTSVICEPREDNALDDATPDGRDKLLATAMVQQFEKTFPELLTAAGTEVQIIETDGF